ncbi:hypothetical protein N7520_003285 [Penicillium odoratum]|uniref:uncharacterized protein n=1 Tax=Penicillium odoratum TaxID=1167516 RepID=UPI002549573A|nr:uncharacterized protein N7520_003285 [Penicillium odoratum]KAJ5768726.1 hypothetical protein N7520_003285 [Penicillium odoratum]
MASARTAMAMGITVQIVQIQHCKILYVKIAVVGGLAGSQITYNSTSGLWACCSYNGGKANCSDPTDQLFPAPAPSSLQTVQYLPKTGSITYNSSATRTSTSNANSSSSSSSSNIGPGAAAGIGVGVGVGVIIIAAIVAFFIAQKRRTQTSNMGLTGAGSLNRSTPRELDNKGMVSEIHSGCYLPELASNS